MLTGDLVTMTHDVAIFTQQDWPLEQAEVTLTHSKRGIEGKSASTDQFEKRISITGPALTPDQRTKLIAVAARCPVQRTLEGTPVIITVAA